MKTKALAAILLALSLGACKSRKVTVQNHSESSTSYMVLIDNEPKGEIAPGESLSEKLNAGESYQIRVIGTSGPQAGQMSESVKVQAKWATWQRNRKVTFTF